MVPAVSLQAACWVHPGAGGKNAGQHRRLDAPERVEGVKPQAGTVEEVRRPHLARDGVAGGVQSSDAAVGQPPQGEELLWPRDGGVRMVRSHEDIRGGAEPEPRQRREELPEKAVLGAKRVPLGGRPGAIGVLGGVRVSEPHHGESRPKLGKQHLGKSLEEVGVVRVGRGFEATRGVRRDAVREPHHRPRPGGVWALFVHRLPVGQRREEGDGQPVRPEGQKERPRPHQALLEEEAAAVSVLEVGRAHLAHRGRGDARVLRRLEERPGEEQPPAIETVQGVQDAVVLGEDRPLEVHWRARRSLARVQGACHPGVVSVKAVGVRIPASGEAGGIHHGERRVGGVAVLKEDALVPEPDEVGCVVHVDGVRTQPVPNEEDDARLRGQRQRRARLVWA